MEIDEDEYRKKIFMTYVHAKLKHVFPVKIPDKLSNPGFMELLDAMYRYDLNCRLGSDLHELESILLKWE